MFHVIYSIKSRIWRFLSTYVARLNYVHENLVVEKSMLKGTVKEKATHFKTTLKLRRRIVVDLMILLCYF